MDSPHENRTPSASVSPESTLTPSPINFPNGASLTTDGISTTRPQSLDVFGNGKTHYKMQINSKCDKEQQTPQETYPPFFIPPPLLSPEINESASDIDNTVSQYLIYR